MTGKTCRLFWVVLASLLTSCGIQRPLLLKPNLSLDTLTLRLDARRVQHPEYQALLQQKLQHFVQVYNAEKNPFQLQLTNETNLPADVSLIITRSRFISRRQSNVGMLVTVAGVGTAAALLASRFFLPLGWVYIPNAKTSLRAELGPGISNLSDFRDITISSNGMYRSAVKQMEIQAKKVTEYLIQIVLQLEEEYKAQHPK